MRYANIKKASEDEQQNQTATKNNCIKSFVRFKKQNLMTKPTYHQIKLKLNQITYKSPENIWDQSIKTLVTIREKEQKQ